jgi:hypothetical protein
MAAQRATVGKLKGLVVGMFHVLLQKKHILTQMTCLPFLNYATREQSAAERSEKSRAIRR